MSDEKRILEETVLELANDVWRVTLSELEEAYRDHSKAPDWKCDPKLIEIGARLSAYRKTLGRLMAKLGNHDLAVKVRSKLVLKFEE